MTRPPDLIDRAALNAHRTRARRDALFLHEITMIEVQERLKEVNRTFTAPAVVTPFPDIWQSALPGMKIVPDTEILGLEPGAHDLVIHGLCLHWANDPVGQLVQCRRALRPDGLLIAATFGGRTLHELRASLAQAEARITGGLSPRVLPMGEIRDLGAVLQRTGLALPVADGFTRTVSYETPLHLMRDLRAMGESNALTQRNRTPARRALFAAMAQIYTAAHASADGRVRATFEMIFLTGWAPDSSQPRPLRPGSATARLADALGANEYDLNGPQD
ncbi:methyltransferase family protein [Rhodovulum imhoffii]|uniref:Methyltransferase family protein n=1 Tax=Rhodovulum imhoffii TaxID=365340 RepID=A0A2T5BP74_9RHOB|nr:methyltransferase domain-containing protein [Rhodovulum imhoffii]MBK5933991.1 SAM-dependent methyltransferase [Rhodovulum imhoffii]PTN00824.1 methyltransferase family protein [Rhodovulum imhoffii]